LKKNQFKKLSQTKQIKIKRIGTKIIKIKKKKGEIEKEFKFYILLQIKQMVKKTKKKI
jgi:hypothetical protein